MGRPSKWGDGEPTSHTTVTIPTRLLERAMVNRVDLSVVLAEAIVARIGYGEPTPESLGFIRRQLETVRDQISLKKTMKDREISGLQGQAAMLEEEARGIEKALDDQARREKERQELHERIATRRYDDGAGQK